jgi:serine/threonine protein kinase
MPAPTTTNEFLDVIRRSKQVDDARLDAYLNDPANKASSNHRKLAANLVRAGVITVFQAEQFLLGKHKGFTLGLYRIIERIGVGGSGTVFFGEHQVMRRRVAIKVLPSALANDHVTLERFRREARASAMLDHENVVHVYDFVEEKGLNAIVMEFVEGPSLQQLIGKRGPLAIPFACEYVRQAAIGLQHAHDMGLVHRDVKPANLLVDASGLVKVLDLGLARYESDGESSLTRQFNSKMVMGTADYLAPEQAISLHEVDRRADIYALGATLYALLAGRPPFDEGSIGQKLLWHQTLEPKRLDELRPEVPAALASLVARMLAKKPEDRPQDCNEVARALQAWALPEGPAGTRPSKDSLMEFSLIGRTGPLQRVTPSNQITPVPMRDTVTAQKEDTARLTIPEALPAVEQPVPAPAPEASKSFVMVAGLVAAAAGVIAGALAMFLLR